MNEHVPPIPDAKQEWVVLVYSGIGGFQCAVGPFSSEEEAKARAGKGSRSGMNAVVRLYRHQQAPGWKDGDS